MGAKSSKPTRFLKVEEGGASGIKKKWSKIERVFGCKECVYFLAIIFPWSDCAVVVAIEEGEGTGTIGGRGSQSTHEQGRWR